MADQQNQAHNTQSGQILHSYQHSSDKTKADAACPYHGPILAMKPENPAKAQSAMARFLHEGSGEQSALFVRSDNGQLSISKNCTCGDKNVESLYGKLEVELDGETDTNTEQK